MSPKAELQIRSIRRRIGAAKAAVHFHRESCLLAVSGIDCDVCSALARNVETHREHLSESFDMIGAGRL